MTILMEKTPRLGELMEPALLAELCKRFVEVNGVGLRVFDLDGAQLAHRDYSPELWGYLFKDSSTKKKLTQFVNTLKHDDSHRDGVHVHAEPITHTHFAVFPLTYEFDLIGRLVVGPYRGAGVQEPPKGYGSLDPQLLAKHTSALSMWSIEALDRQVSLLQKSVEITCHAGYRVLLTSQIHIDSINEAANQLASANSELAESNEALRANLKRQRELDTLKSNFLATVSHELRTPLTSVIGYSEMLLGGLAGEMNGEQQEYVDTIMGRANALLGLIDTILDISRIQRGGVSLNLDYTDVNTVIEGAIASVTPQAVKREIHLLTQMEPELPDVQIDGQKVGQVLVNLLNNAIKFTPVRGQVTLGARRCTLPSASPSAAPRAGLLFSVRDTGVGIPPAHLSRIFDAFYQVDNSATRHYGGAGLGLSIAKSFVEAHGGRIDVHSRQGQGTEFSFMLPTEQALKIQ